MPDPATDKQLAYLRSLGVLDIPAGLTKSEASELIDKRLSQASSRLSEKQIACLEYHGFDPDKMSFVDAKAMLDAIHEHPGKFPKAEAWEIAKYRLHPDLYPIREKRASGLSVGIKGCFIVIGAYLALGLIIQICFPKQPAEKPGAKSNPKTENQKIESTKTQPPIPPPGIEKSKYYPSY